jgi:transposase
MPRRSDTREQGWLLPPRLDELIPVDHPVRFTAAFLAALEPADRAALGLDQRSDPLGRPAYDPAVLLAVWVYGFMSGVRSSRALEAACRDQLPYLWLTGCQRPDHNTLWRYYAAHRGALRRLLRRTVRTAVQAGLVELALVAVDGTRVAGSAARARHLDAAGLRALLGRVEQALADLEAQHQGRDDPPPPRLPRDLAGLEALQTRVQQALAAVAADDGPDRANVTDPDATLQKQRDGGFVVGYNAQAAVSPLDPAVAGAGGQLIVAADVTADRDDHTQLLGLLDQAAALTGVVAPEVLADGGYHSAANLAGCAARGQMPRIPDPQAPRADQPYHKDHFRYDPATDTYTCPQGQTLRFAGLVVRPGDEPVARRYRARRALCAGCPARAACTRSRSHGRSITIRPDEARLRAHRAAMATDPARAAYRRRKTLPEPVFGVLKSCQAARRLLLRGLANVRAEWALLAAAYNLRVLWRVWRAQGGPAGLAGAGLAAA